MLVSANRCLALLAKVNRNKEDKGKSMMHTGVYATSHAPARLK